MNALDELEYWLQLLTLEVYRGAEKRHIKALSRLCEVFAEKLARDKSAPADQLERRMRLTLGWLDMQRKIAGIPAVPALRSVPRPPMQKRVGKLRVINGGRTQSGATRR